MPLKVFHDFSNGIRNDTMAFTKCHENYFKGVSKMS
jgi:hypothetical protein